MQSTALNPQRQIQHIAQFILGQQQSSGALPWFEHGKLDPWDHCEALMALSLDHKFTAAKRAFGWLREHQNADGTWFAKYLGEVDDADLDRYKVESNFVAYPATALWHYYLCSTDKSFLQQQFTVVEAAIDYVVGQQQPQGDIQWAQSACETLPRDALLTACSSILRSIECAMACADVVKAHKPAWLEAYRALAETVKNKPWRFDRTWESKARFSMDWFYPVLSGVYNPEESALRLRERWSDFIVPNLGCRCVSDEPWITVAESAELVMALCAAEQRSEAKVLLHQLSRWQDADGGFWTGYVYRDKAVWPEEKTTWTAAAIALATDAVYCLSPAHTLFTQTNSIY